MTELQKLIEDVKRVRDEVGLKIHLAGLDAQKEWHSLEERWQAFRDKAELDQTAKGVGNALGQLAGELKSGYLRLRKAL